MFLYFEIFLKTKRADSEVKQNKTKNDIGKVNYFKVEYFLSRVFIFLRPKVAH